MAGGRPRRSRADVSVERAATSRAWDRLRDAKFTGLCSSLPPAVLVGLAATAALGALQLVMPHQKEPHADEFVYERMASDPFGAHTFPFGYRIGIPLLVHVLPFSHDVSFFALALVCAGVAAAVLYALMTELGASPPIAAGGALVFATSPGIVVALLRNGRTTDVATLLMMSAAALFIVRRRPVALATTLLLGAFVRESMLFMIPFAYAMWAERPLDRSAIRRVTAVSLPAVAAYAALRLSLPTVGREQVAGYSGPFLDARADVVAGAVEDWPTLLRRSFLVFGPLWLVAPFAFRGMRYARRGMVLVALCIVALTYAIDWPRVLLLLVPLVYPAAAWVLRARLRLAAGVAAGCVACSATYAVYMARTGIDNLDNPPPPAYSVR